MQVWDHISTGPMLAQGNKDGAVHGANAPCMPDQNSKLWHSRSQAFLRAEYQKDTSVLVARSKNARKKKQMEHFIISLEASMQRIISFLALS